MEEMAQNMSDTIADLELKIDAMGLKIDGLVNASKTNGEVADMQTKLGLVLWKIGGLTHREIFRAINILATNYDLLRVFFSMPEEMKRLYIQNLTLYGLK